MPRKSVRAAAAVLVTAPLLIALASTGGLSYAASSVDRVARSVSGATTAKHRVVVLHLTAGSDQYEPGYGFGDPNHNHAGPPGLIREGLRTRDLSPTQSLALPPSIEDGAVTPIALPEGEAALPAVAANSFCSIRFLP